MTLSTARLAVAGPDIIFEDFDGDLVVLNLKSGQYFGFNPAAAVVWEALMAGAAPSALAEASPDPAAIAPFAQRLLDLELVVVADAAPADLAPDAAERVAALAEAPQVQVYDDLADLIVADPIHDVDQEAGWPHMPPQS